MPKIEVGAALGAQYLADYRGSEEYVANAIPFPIFQYRGERFKIDRSGIRGDLLKEKSWELNVSGEVALNGGDDDNEKRRGMPELNSAFEFGPSFNYALDGNIDDDGWMIRLPVRAVVAAGLDRVEHIGFVFNPKLTYLYDRGTYNWRSSTSIGALWGSEDWRYGVSLRYDNLAGASFRDSPLVETDHFFTVSFLFARYLWKSKD